MQSGKNSHLSSIGIQDSVCDTKQEAGVAGIHQELAQALQQRQQASRIPPTCKMSATASAQLDCVFLLGNAAAGSTTGVSSEASRRKEKSTL